MFVDVFEKICESNGIAPSRVLDNLSITRSAYSRWSKGGSPSNETKKKIADYFGISVRQLMDGETENAPARVESEDDELERQGDWWLGYYHGANLTTNGLKTRRLARKMTQKELAAFSIFLPPRQTHRYIPAF